ncbi:steroid 17-alpha-hydroxylase 17,20 lyase-like [Paramuricea clavata]|nr:steroid 17-alpha-hydroxylase 17,20 lyase-like [Paramuricea clavata]
MPPGPIPYPFIGNIPHMMCDPVNPFGHLAEKYGDIYSLSLPMGNVVVVSTSSLIRDARLGRNDDLSGKSAKSMFPFPDILGNDLAVADFSTAYLFRKRVFKSAIHIFGSGIAQAEDRARHAVDLAIAEIETQRPEPFSPKKVFESAIYAQIWEWLTSRRVPLNDPTIKSLINFGDTLVGLPVISVLYQAIPFLSYLPSKFQREIKRAQKIRDDLLTAEFRYHQQTYTPGVIRDLTDSFICAYEKENAKESRKDIGSVEDIPYLMLDVAFAGADTTSASLAWFFLFMVRHQDIQKKLHEELDRAVMENGCLPSSVDPDEMPYMQATICEIERVSGLVITTATNAIRDITLGGYHIPKGCLVVLNIRKVHLDEREWPEHDKFKPERFLDSAGKFIGWSKLPGFIPFGLGRRECPGQSLAKIMMFTFASTLLHRYKIELPDGGDLPTTEPSESDATVATVRPKNFQVVAKKRF